MSAARWQCVSEARWQCVSEKEQEKKRESEKGNLIMPFVICIHLQHSLSLIFFHTYLVRHTAFFKQIIADATSTRVSMVIKHNLNVLRGPVRVASHEYRVSLQRNSQTQRRCRHRPYTRVHTSTNTPYLTYNACMHAYIHTYTKGVCACMRSIYDHPSQCAGSV